MSVIVMISFQVVSNSKNSQNQNIQAASPVYFKSAEPLHRNIKYKSASSLRPFEHIDTNQFLSGEDEMHMVKSETESTRSKKENVCVPLLQCESFSLFSFQQHPELGHAFSLPFLIGSANNNHREVSQSPLEGLDLVLFFYLFLTSRLSCSPIFSLSTRCPTGAISYLFLVLLRRHNPCLCWQSRHQGEIRTSGALQQNLCLDFLFAWGCLLFSKHVFEASTSPYLAFPVNNPFILINAYATLQKFQEKEELFSSYNFRIQAYITLVVHHISQPVMIILSLRKEKSNIQTISYISLVLIKH